MLGLRALRSTAGIYENRVFFHGPRNDRAFFGGSVMCPTSIYFGNNFCRDYITDLLTSSCTQ